MMKNLIQKSFRMAGYEISRVRKYNNRDQRWACWPGQKQIAETFFEIDERFHDLYDAAQEKTQMTATDHPIRRQRHYTLNYLLWTTNLEGGDVCELGVRRGLSAYQIASHLKQNHPSKTFHIFDSFEGLSDLDPVDEPTDRHQDNDAVKTDYACPLETVRENLSSFDFIVYHQGWIPDKFDEVKDKTFSFVHVDVDLYQPVKDTIEYFYPRLKNQGVMVFDDYGCMQFPGAKKAVDDYLAHIKHAFFLPLPSGQAFLIKGIGQ